MRVFVATKIPESSTLSDLIFKINHSLIGIRASYSKIENIHLTISFLGEISENLLYSISELLKSVTSVSTKFNLEIEKLGTFSKNNKPSVLWLGVSKNEKLEFLWNTVNKLLAENKLISTIPIYKPHITLARIKSILGNSNLEEIITTINKESKSINFELTSIDLYKSTLLPDGPRYDLIQKFELIG